MRITNIFIGDHKQLDSRLTNERHVNFAFGPPPISTRAAWERHAQWVRRRIRIAAGLCPEPERTPLNARIFERSQLDGCTVEKVCFESRPGFLVTGNIFRPPPRRKKNPAILCPHGHYKKGRMTSEDPRVGGVMSRCLMLARLGFVVFAYDMVGYNDSCQVVHRWKPSVLNRSYLYGIGPFGLQLWNSIRALDFVSGLPDVDPRRIGCTGGSGGATQTYCLAAVDERVRAVVPVCMMSSHYQGGCTCEEAPLLHLDDLSTVDIVGAIAPRPVLLISVTNDWTNQTPEHEFPIVRKIWSLYGAQARITNAHFPGPHGYRKEMREHVYPWFRRWLANDKRAPKRIREPELKYPTAEQLRLFPDNKPPRTFITGSRFFEKLFAEETQVFSKPPQSAGELRALKKNWSEVYHDVIGANAPLGIVSVGRPVGDPPLKGFTVLGRTIGRYGRGEQIPAAWIVPASADKQSPAAVVLCENGKSTLFRKTSPKPFLAALLQAGIRVLAVDLLGKGETASLLAGERLDRKDPIFHTFNRSLVAHRVQEVITVLAALRQHEGVARPALIGFGIGAAIALLARPLAGRLQCTVADLGKYATDHDRFWLGEMYHPFIRKLGGLRGAVALGPTSPLMLVAQDEGLRRWTRAVYRLERKASSLRIYCAPQAEKAVAKWIKKKPA